MHAGSSSPTRDLTPGSLHREHRVLPTGPPGKSQTRNLKGDESNNLCSYNIPISSLGKHKLIYFFVFYYRVRPYFSDIVNSLDAAIIVVTLLVNIAYIFYDFKVLKDFPE